MLPRHPDEAALKNYKHSPLRKENETRKLNLFTTLFPFDSKKMRCVK